jgi:hypothetical protein
MSSGYSLIDLLSSGLRSERKSIELSQDAKGCAKSPISYRLLAKEPACHGSTSSSCLTGVTVALAVSSVPKSGTTKRYCEELIKDFFCFYVHGWSRNFLSFLS